MQTAIILFNMVVSPLAILAVQRNLSFTFSFCFSSSFPGVVSHLVSYPVPVGLSYAWGFGSLSGILLAVQVVSGLLLTSVAVVAESFVFVSVEGTMMREAWDGYVWRAVHSNVASGFFVAVYLHVSRGLVFGLFSSNGSVWGVGAVVYVVMMGTAFLGYVLVWGQMSFWGATVISNMVGAVPLVGSSMLEWVWGGFCVSDVTLRRFFVLHFVLPFLLLALVGVHLVVLHSSGSGSRLGFEGRSEVVSFYPYCYVKDLVGVLVGLLGIGGVVAWCPGVFGHSDNAIMADSLLTPAHIVPEWYFLPFYAMLRLVPHKLLGILLMAGGILMLFLLPLYRFECCSGVFFSSLRRGMQMFVGSVLVLGVLGGRGTEAWEARCGVVALAYYFAWVLILLPALYVVSSSRVASSAVSIPSVGVVVRVYGCVVVAASRGPPYACRPGRYSCVSGLGVTGE